MSFLAGRTPKYRHHKPRNLAVVRIDGPDHYLGKFRSQEIYEQYDRPIAEWLVSRHQSNCSRDSAPVDSPGEIRGNELVLAFWRHAKERYVKNGKPTSEVHSVKVAPRQQGGFMATNRFCIAGAPLRDREEIRRKLREAEKNRRGIAICMAICVPLLIRAQIWFGWTKGIVFLAAMVGMSLIPFSPGIMEFRSMRKEIAKLKQVLKVEESG